MTETPESLRERGGIDLTNLSVGTEILVETTAGVYEITIVTPEDGTVIVKATVSPFNVHKPTMIRLERSIWDDKGKIALPHWIGKAMRMVFRDDDNGLFATHSVVSARVISPDGTWEYEIWEED
jgi:hypothetical protein